MECEAGFEGKTCFADCDGDEDCYYSCIEENCNFDDEDDEDDEEPPFFLAK